jgi:hypothetical protein
MIQPVQLDGSPRAAPFEAGWPLRIEGPARITIRSETLRGLPRGTAPLLEFKSSEAEPVAVALVVDGG